MQKCLITIIWPKLSIFQILSVYSTTIWTPRTGEPNFPFEKLLFSSDQLWSKTHYLKRDDVVQYRMVEISQDGYFSKKLSHLSFQTAAFSNFCTEQFASIVFFLLVKHRVAKLQVFYTDQIFQRAENSIKLSCFKDKTS